MHVSGIVIHGDGRCVAILRSAERIGLGGAIPICGKAEEGALPAAAPIFRAAQIFNQAHKTGGFSGHAALTVIGNKVQLNGLCPGGDNSVSDFVPHQAKAAGIDQVALFIKTEVPGSGIFQN